MIDAPMCETTRCGYLGDGPDDPMRPMVDPRTGAMLCGNCWVRMPACEPMPTPRIPDSARPRFTLR